MPVELFFGWMKIHGPDGEPAEVHKQPYVIAIADRRPFALPAFWESWTDGTTGIIARSFAIVTCPTNSLIAEIHDRMPVIIALESRERCIANIEPDPVDLMVPYPADLMAMWPISSKVNSPGFNRRDEADPIEGA
jgi:putative SOS response-associated peptidase YedK